MSRLAYWIGWVLGYALAVALWPLFALGNLVRWWDDRQRARAEAEGRRLWDAMVADAMASAEPEPHPWRPDPADTCDHAWSTDTSPGYPPYCVRCGIARGVELKPSEGRALDPEDHG